MIFLTLEGMYRDGRLELKDAHPNSPIAERGLVASLSSVEGAGVEATANEAAVERLITGMQTRINFGGVKFDRDEVYSVRFEVLDERRAPHCLRSSATSVAPTNSL